MLSKLLPMLEMCKPILEKHLDICNLLSMLKDKINLCDICHKPKPDPEPEPKPWTEDSNPCHSKDNDNNY